MKNEHKLIKNTLILSIGTMFPKMVSIITIPILTAGLSKADYGTYDLITTLVSLLLPVLTLQIQSAAFRFLIECRGDKVRSSVITTNIFVVTVPVSAIALTILYFVLYQLSPLVRLLICAYYLFDIIFLAVQQLARGIGQNLYYSISAIIVSVVNLLTILLLISGMSLGLTGILISLAVSYAIALAFLCIKIAKKLNIKREYISFACIKEMLLFSWPMVPNNLSSWVLSLSDRLIITAVLGVEANAVYAVATKIPKLFSTVQSTFTLAWQENASEVSKEENAYKYYSDMFDTIFRFMCGVMALVIASTPVLFIILIRGDYGDAYAQMPMLFMGVLFSSISAFFGGIYIACKRTKSIGITTICAAAINLLVDCICVKPLGITAGSLSTMVSYLFLSVYRMIDIRKSVPLKYNFKLLLGGLLFLSGMGILCLQQSFIYNVINFIIGVVFAVILNLKFIKSIWNTIRKKLLR